MKKGLPKILTLFAALTLCLSTAWGTSLALLNFSEPTDLPANYVYNTANSPAIATFAEKSCINVGNGGTPSFSADIFTTDGFDASKGKRWMGFVIDESCDLVITCGVGNTSRTFSLYKSDGTKFCADKTFTATNSLVDWEIGSLPAGRYVLIPSGSSAYVSAMTFSAATPACPTTVTISGTKKYVVGDKITLTASSNGNGALLYQWYKGGKEEINKLDGKTASKLEIEDCVLGDAGDYFCRINKSDCAGAVNDAAYSIAVGAVGSDLTAHTHQEFMRKVNQVADMGLL